jgi:chemotaxis protein MotB
MSSHSKRKHVNHERWLVSYADFITLLFAFFVVLYSASKADQKKRSQVADSINSAFRTLGIFPDSKGKPSTAETAENGSEKPTEPMSVVVGQDVLSAARVQQDLERIRDQLQQTLAKQIAQHSVSIQMGRDGLVISLREAGFFDSGSAAPKPESISTLRQIASSIGHTAYNVRVEGHTDNVPIHTGEFDSNWELSSARATRIARLFLDLNAIAPDRLSAAGFAEFHPVAGNDTAEGRAQNRRVDLVVMPRSQIDFSAHGAQKPSGAWRKIIDDN